MDNLFVPVIFWQITALLVLYTDTRYISTSINIDQITLGYFSIDSTISRDHIFSSLWIDASGCFTSTKSGGCGRCFKAVINLMLRDRKKKSRFYPRKICRVMDSDPFVRRDCACPTHATRSFFASNSEVAVGRKAEKREIQKFIHVLLYSTVFLPKMRHYTSAAFRCFQYKKVPFFGITSITAVLFEAVCSVHVMHGIDRFVFYWR